MAQRDLTHLSAFLDQLRPLIPEPAAAQFNLLNILQVSSRCLVFRLEPMKKDSTDGGMH